MTSSASPQKKLNVFLCYTVEDKSKVEHLYDRLKKEETWISPWLDEEDLLPGQDRNMATIEALRRSDVIIVCLSKTSVVKEGYVQKIIKQALDISEEKPDNTIFILPWLLEDCDVPPSLAKYYYLAASATDVYTKLLKSLKLRAEDLNLTVTHASENGLSSEYLDLYVFNKIVTEEVSYTFYIGKYPVTNAQYKRFLDSPDFFDPEIWTGFHKFNEDYIELGYWGNEGVHWLKSVSDTSAHLPSFWDEDDFGIAKPNNPVVGVTWYEASAYCKWLLKSWRGRNLESIANPKLKPIQIRLPLESEWEAAAGGVNPESRYPWDKDGSITTSDKEIARRANVNGNIGHTTLVNAYGRGASYPSRVMDMAGNVWEWQSNFYDKRHKGLALRGGSWKYYQYGARVSSRYAYFPDDQSNDVGFRVAIIV